MSKEFLKKWIKAATVRAVKTVAQTAAATIGTAAVLGDVNWGAFISALNDIRFNGCAVIEVEDKAFESSKEDILNSIRLSKRYLDNYLI